MLPKFIDQTKIPHKPGVYIFKNQLGEIIYVGKAIDLYSRVSSYFSGFRLPKVEVLATEISGLETILVQSEVEALILEANLIKQHLPRFNVKLTDDKDFLYIKVTKEAYPKVVTARKKELEPALEYFGPFPSSSTVRQTLKRLRRVFPWCSNPPKTDVRCKACFHYHLGLCPGPCAGVMNQSDYRKIIHRFIKFMKGESNSLINELSREMNKCAKMMNFEEAGKIKQTIVNINYLLEPSNTHLYLEDPNYYQSQRDASLLALQQDLGLHSKPERIEVYDISNFQGKDAVGSMVVLTLGEIDKSQYRKFKIKSPSRPNDFLMISEILIRRINHPEWPTPDLILIDGGKGQVSAAAKVLIKAGLEISLFGLAKRMEWLYDVNGAVIKLKRSSLSLRLLQKIRDEAHRFALNYHRKLRHNSMYNKVNEVVI